MLHRHDDARAGGDEVHGAAHPLHHLARNNPVRNVARCAYLQRAEHGQVDARCANHPKALRGGEEAGARDGRDRLFARVYPVGVRRALAWVGPHAEQAVFRLQLDAHALRHIV